MRVLIWNLFHGRAVPPAGRPLDGEFFRLIAGWEWDLALLQEVPPWWPPRLAAAAGAQQRTALTSRNGLLAARKLIAEHWPDAIKSNGGGANALLARGTITEHYPLRVRRWPERRVAQLARLSSGTWVVNLHLSTRPPLAAEELARSWAAARVRAGDGALLLGGDLNLRDPVIPEPGVEHLAARDVDHLFARGLTRVGDVARLEASIELPGGRRVQLSDHPPLIVTLRPA